MYKILLLIGFFIGLINTQAQIVNEGVLKIEPGTTVYFGDDYTNESGATHTNDGNLHLEGNLTNDGTVTTTAAATGTTYFNSSATATQVLNGTASAAKFYNLTVNNASTDGESLEVTDGYNLEVTNNVVITTGQKLRLMGEAQLVQTHSGVTTNSGDGHLLKDQEGAQNAYRYNYWSSPVQNDAGIIYNVSTILKDATVANQWSPTQVSFTTALDGTNGTPIALSTRWMWKYVDSTVDPYNDQDWVQLFDMGTTTPSSGANISPAQGFIMKGTNTGAAYADTQNYSFEGKPNDGDYTLLISADKEYLVGNPYPSALDANTFLSDNNAIIDSTIWFWEHWSTDTHVYADYGAGYIVYTPGSGSVQASLHGDFSSGTNNATSGIVTALPDNYRIPVGQGFIVRSVSTGGGTITFKNSQRVFHKENASSIFVRNANSEANISRIRLGYEDPSQRHRFLLLAFTENGTDVYDNGFDGEMIDVADDDMFFTMIDDDRNLPYAIQGVGEYNVESSYPLTIKVATAGEHHIILDTTENFEQDIYILDKDENTTYNIRENNFTVNLDAGEYANRFEVVFQPQAPLEVDNYLNDLVTAFYINNEIVIQNTTNATLTGLQVYNSIGQLVYQNTNQGQLSATEVRIPFEYAQAAYILKLSALKGKGSYKFINY